MRPLSVLMTIWPNSSGCCRRPLTLTRILETLPGRRRRHADLTGGDLLVLLLNGLDHLLRRRAQRDQLVRIEPDAHRIFAGAEHAGMTDAGDPRQLVDEVDRRVIAEIKPVVPAVRRAQRHHLQEGGRLLPHRHALRLHALRQGRQGAGDAVLHPDLRQVQVGAGLERDSQRVVAVAGARRLHVEHAFDAVDRALDRQRDGVDEGLRAAARKAGGHRRSSAARRPGTRRPAATPEPRPRSGRAGSPGHWRIPADR